MKPILFNQSMVKAIQDNRKTVTRRVIKNVNSIYRPFEVGDILYVRETWKIYEKRSPDGLDIKKIYGYKTDENNPNNPSEFYETKWHPSIHMPKEAARIFLKVTDIRVERLQDITEEQAIKEGIQHFDTKPDETFGLTKKEVWFENPMYCFKWLWNSTIKKQDIDKYGWNANPWVWVIEFERVETTNE